MPELPCTNPSTPRRTCSKTSQTAGCPLKQRKIAHGCLQCSHNFEAGSGTPSKVVAPVTLLLRLSCRIELSDTKQASTSMQLRDIALEPLFKMYHIILCIVPLHGWAKFNNASSSHRNPDPRRLRPFQYPPPQTGRSAAAGHRRSEPVTKSRRSATTQPVESCQDMLFEILLSHSVVYTAHGAFILEQSYDTVNDKENGTTWERNRCHCK